jgi:hypothetical protein
VNTVELRRDFGIETEVPAGIDPGETAVVDPSDDLSSRTVLELVALPIESSRIVIQIMVPIKDLGIDRKERVCLLAGLLTGVSYLLL